MCSFLLCVCFPCFFCICPVVGVYVCMLASTLFQLYDAVRYGVAIISRLLAIIGLFAEYRLFYRALLQKRPINLASTLSLLNDAVR